MSTNTYKLQRINLQNIPTDTAFKIVEVQLNMVLEAMLQLDPRVQGLEKPEPSPLVFPITDRPLLPQEGQVLNTGSSLEMYLKNPQTGVASWVPIVRDFWAKGE